MESSYLLLNINCIAILSYYTFSVRVQYVFVGICGKSNGKQKNVSTIFTMQFKMSNNNSFIIITANVYNRQY